MTVSTTALPKYWNGRDVAYGVQLKQEATPFDALYGTYGWIYVHDSRFGASSDPESGHLTLARPPQHGTSTFTAAAAGSFSLGRICGTLAALERDQVVRGRLRVIMRPEADEGGSAPGQERQERIHFLDVASVADDAGRPMLHFTCTVGLLPDGRPHRVYALGKRVEAAAPPPPTSSPSRASDRGRRRRRVPSGAVASAEGTSAQMRVEAKVRLTARDRARLGIGMDEREVERRAREEEGERGVLGESTNVEAGAKRKR